MNAKSAKNTLNAQIGYYYKNKMAYNERHSLKILFIVFASELSNEDDYKI